MREINVAPPGAGDRWTLCHAGCNGRMPLSGARICAILICGICRQDPVKLNAARTENAKHMRAHTIHERQTNPWYPFEDFSAAWGAV